MLSSFNFPVSDVKTLILSTEEPCSPYFPISNGFTSWALSPLWEPISRIPFGCACCAKNPRPLSSPYMGSKRWISHRCRHVVRRGIPWTVPWVLSGLILFFVVGGIAGALYIPAQKKNRMRSQCTQPAVNISPPRIAPAVSAWSSSSWWCSSSS